MITHKPTGWNTWDFRGFNRLVYLRQGRTIINLQYAIWDEDHRPADEVKNRGGLHHNLRWQHATRLGPHAPLGLPAKLEFKINETSFEAEAIDENGTLCLTVRPLSETRMRVVYRLLAPDGDAVHKTSTTSGTFAGCRLEFTGATWPQDYFLNVAEPYALGGPGGAATVRVTPPGATSSSGGTLAALESTSVVGEGALADAPGAMLPAVTWNTLYDTRRRLVSSPVSRDWMADWRGVTVFCWDTYFVGAMIAHAFPELARLNFETVTAAIDELGHVPNYYMAHGAASFDRSMPPIGAYIVWKTQAARPDTAWLLRMYRPLCRWHAYWMAHRDGNGDGLLEWGSDAAPAFEFPQLLQDNPQLQHSAKCAMYESGLDNSPMYDDVPFNAQTNTFELADIGLSSYYALDCEALARIAAALGRKSDAARYQREYETMARRINETLWDEEAGIYANRHWDGRFSRRWSPTSFFPLLAGVAPAERAARLVHEHLLNEREFWGEYVLPSIARNDPAYPDNDYWRGRIWGPFNFLVAEGLRRYRFDDVAAELARRSLDLFMRNWRADGGVYENYNADTGVGADVWNAARLYHWGGLLAYIAMQELIDVEPTGYLRFGSRKFPHAGLRRVHVGGAVYDVDMQNGMRVWRNGALLLETEPRAIVRLPLACAGDVPIEISTEQGGRLTLHESKTPPRPARVNGETLITPTGTPATYTW
ncbi:MAG: trehalase family glycosidase [Phycisphaerae bacterium]|jgi:hypothetical protein